MFVLFITINYKRTESILFRVHVAEQMYFSEKNLIFFDFTGVNVIIAKHVGPLQNFQVGLLQNSIYQKQLISPDHMFNLFY